MLGVNKIHNILVWENKWDVEYHFTTGRIELPEKVVKYIINEYENEYC